MVNLIDKLEDMGLVERCYDCNHISFHPIWWIRNLFKKHKKHIPSKYAEISPIQSKWIMQELLKLANPMILTKYSQKNPLPENKSGKIKFRRYSND
jgi:hypothetical protein